MSDFKNQYQASTTEPSAAAHDGPAGSYPVFKQPVAITVARGFQIFLALLIAVLAGLLMHGLVMDAIAFALVCVSLRSQKCQDDTVTDSHFQGIFTLIIVIYALVVEKAPSCRSGYNYWAILSLDLFMAILWLSSMGASAALRASFVYDVDAECYNDGSTFNSGHCVVSKRAVAAVATKVGLAEMSAVAGLSALQMLLFIATTAYLGHQVRMHLEANKKRPADNGNVEMKAQTQPMLTGQPQPQMNAVPQQQMQPIQPQYTGQTYTSQAYPQQQPQPYDSYAYSQAQMGPQVQPQAQQHPQAQQQPQYQQYPQGQTPSPAPQAQYGYPPQVQQQPQMYSPAGTPAQQQQPYYPPAQ